MLFGIVILVIFILGCVFKIKKKNEKKKKIEETINVME